MQGQIEAMSGRRKPNSRSAFGLRRSVCDEFTHGLKSSVRSNNGFTPRFGAFFGRSHGMIKFLVFFVLASCPSYELLIELFFNKCRQKILNRHSLAV